MNKTGIEYLDFTYNPVTGCTPVSEGCQNCWARAMHGRKLWGDQPFSEVRIHPLRLEQPLRVRKPARIGVCFMGDLWHEKVPNEFIASALGYAHTARQHSYFFLTKRAERLPDFFAWFQKWTMGAWPREYPHVWLGVSVENQATADERIPLLLQTPAAHRWVSIEPMLDDIDLTHLPCAYCGADIGVGGDSRRIIDPASPLHPRNTGDDDDHDWCPACTDVGEPKLHGIDWVVVGGESGPKARPCDVGWIRSIVSQCKAAGVPVWVKQDWKGGQGRIPDDLWAIKELPNATRS